MFIHVDIKVENLAKPFLTLFGLENSEDTVVSQASFLVTFNRQFQLPRLIVFSCYMLN